MIALLRGRVVSGGVGDVVVDVGGVGYEVLVPAGTALAIGAELVVHTHLVVREDALTLYGFPAPGDRALFATLLAVPGIGPKLALATIGALGGDGLRRAIATEDIAALTAVPGLGRKSAQRLVLDLRGKLVADGDAAGRARAADSAPVGAAGPREEVRAALAALGYDAGEIAAALRALPADTDVGVEALLRDALRTLSGTVSAR